MLLTAALLLASGASYAPFQDSWLPIRQIGVGGESTICPDGKGNVYVTAHLPCSLFVSRDWGETFTKKKQFNDGLGDMFVKANPDGHVYVVYMVTGKSFIEGLRVWSSTDYAETLTEGNLYPGLYDREWLTVSPTGTVYMDYSDGYIGGPKSKGVYLAASVNDGKEFFKVSRIDNERAGSYAVDPYLTSLPNGRIVGMWQVSTDYDTVDSWRTSYSDDKGKTFTGHTTVGVANKSLEGKKLDTQERWMLGCITALGENTIVVSYMDWIGVDINGTTEPAFVAKYRVSTNGGESYGPEQKITSDAELKSAVETFVAGRKSGSSRPYYTQILPWMCADPSGNLHFVYTDNRAGQDPVSCNGKWQLRYSECADLAKGFGPSEVVSDPYVAPRPPMDFVSCGADSKFFYVSWTEDLAGGFTGKLLVRRKSLSR